MEELQTLEYFTRKAQEDKARRLPRRIAIEAVKFGAGFYVGFLDGQSTPLDSTTKYALLTTPSLVHGSFMMAGSYWLRGVIRKVSHEEILRESTDNLDDNCKTIVKEGVEKIANMNLLLESPRILTKTAGFTAVKTMAGYAAGYGLAKLLY